MLREQTTDSRQADSRQQTADNRQVGSRQVDKQTIGPTLSSYSVEMSSPREISHYSLAPRRKISLFTCTMIDDREQPAKSRDQTAESRP
jgi:hypothetical protein